MNDLPMEVTVVSMLFSFQMACTTLITEQRLVVETSHNKGKHKLSHFCLSGDQVLDLAAQQQGSFTSPETTGSQGCLPWAPPFLYKFMSDFNIIGIRQAL